MTALTSNTPSGSKSETRWKTYEQSVCSSELIPRCHLRPAEAHVAMPSLRSHVARIGSATTVTVVDPIVALPVTFLHWFSPIHNQVGRPTYVISGGFGAIFTVGFTNGIDSTIV